MDINSPPSTSYNAISPAETESTFAGSPIKAEDAGGSEPPKKKQKRNKPTLSCEECVERKTKCDRGRPNCLACIKRQSTCKYASVANIIEETKQSAGSTKRMTKPPKRKGVSTSNFEGPKQAPSPHQRSDSRGSISSSIGLLSNVPYSHPSASNVFGIGSEHPFANYWTCQGGLAETISVLPDKLQADILLERYFECVDPVYPMIHRQTFYTDYEHFWSLPQLEKQRIDAALVALIFSMLAMGTQFTTTPAKERQQTAEFYVSAAHQSLRMSSYLNKASIRSIQAMVLITYFLINDNHASDGWAFAGILSRQAYAMGLHRDPNIVCPNASNFEKQQRRKLWQAVLLQDTFLTVLLSLPPSATHTDVNVSDLIDDPTPNSNSSSPTIAPNISLSANLATDPTDTAYIRGCWNLANLVQETICSPRSLDLPICSTPRQKTKLLADFKAVFRSFPDIFRSWDNDSLALLAVTRPRIVRQTLFLTSNYYHNVMLVHSSGSTSDQDPSSPDQNQTYPNGQNSTTNGKFTSHNVEPSPRGALEAAHDAINAFFLLFKLFEGEAKVWWVFNHRAFLEAMCIGNILREQNAIDSEIVEKDLLYVRGKGDIEKMISIMRQMSEGEQGSNSNVAATRVSVLSTYL